MRKFQKNHIRNPTKKLKNKLYEPKSKIFKFRRKNICIQLLEVLFFREKHFCY